MSSFKKDIIYKFENPTRFDGDLISKHLNSYLLYSCHILPNIEKHRFSNDFFKFFVYKNIKGETVFVSTKYCNLMHCICFQKNEKFLRSFTVFLKTNKICRVIGNKDLAALVNALLPKDAYYEAKKTGCYF